MLDIDGTLTNSQKEISPDTKRGIINIEERGHKVVLASGRPTPGMRRCNGKCSGRAEGKGGFCDKKQRTNKKLYDTSCRKH